MKKVLWFSRHDLTDAQKSDLVKVLDSEITINHVNRTVNSAYELKSEINDCDIACVVMPLNLQQQMLWLLGEKPMLIGRNHRTQQDEDGNFILSHAGWDKISRIEIVKETLSDVPAPEGAYRK